MNLSGKAVKYWLDKEKIPVENMLVIVDDLALPLEALRVRAAWYPCRTQRFAGYTGNLEQHGLSALTFWRRQ